MLKENLSDTEYQREKKKSAYEFKVNLSELPI